MQGGELGAGANKNCSSSALPHPMSSCFSLVVTALFPPSFYAFAKAPANHLEMVVFMFNMLAIGLVHLPATSHLRSGLTHHHSALCIVIGASLGQLVIVRHYALLLRHLWANLSLFSTLCHHQTDTALYSLGPTCHQSALCVIIRPSSLVGSFIVIGSWSGPYHCQNITGPYSFSLGLIVVGLSYSSSLGPHSLMLA